MKNLLDLKKLSGSDWEYECSSLRNYLQKQVSSARFRMNQDLIFILVSEGEIQLTAGYNQFLAKTGQLVIIQPQKPYEILNFSANISGFILIIKHGGLLNVLGNHALIFELDFLDPWGESVYNIESERLNYIENVFRRINYQKNIEPQNLTIISAYIIVLVLELESLHRYYLKFKRAEIEITKKFKKLISENIQNSYNISKYAELLGVSPNHLNKSVKKSLGIPASQLLARFKTVEAKILLMQIDLNISEIAERVGFKDVYHFSRFFKKQTGLSPSAYREMIDFAK